MGNNNSSFPFFKPVPVEYGSGIIKTFSISGPPATYIQVDDNNLKQCLQYTNDQNTINQCISQNIYTPSVAGTLSNVNLWTGEQLPPNPACNFVFKKSTQPAIVFAGAGPGQIASGIINNFDNIDNIVTNNDNITLAVVIVITILIVLTK